uniref:ZM domain-containing protein n=1 Tax=Heterorhabditis bacteriophora TaxID=37862 RepID=A0A1I7XK05_HETBA
MRWIYVSILAISQCQEHKNRDERIYSFDIAPTYSRFTPFQVLESLPEPVYGIAHKYPYDLQPSERVSQQKSNTHTNNDMKQFNPFENTDGRGYREHGKQVPQDRNSEIEQKSEDDQRQLFEGRNRTKLIGADIEMVALFHPSEKLSSSEHYDPSNPSVMDQSSPVSRPYIITNSQVLANDGYKKEVLPLGNPYPRNINLQRIHTPYTDDNEMEKEIIPKWHKPTPYDAYFLQRKYSDPTDAERRPHMQFKGEGGVRNKYNQDTPDPRIHSHTSLPQQFFGNGKFNPIRPQLTNPLFSSVRSPQYQRPLTNPVRSEENPIQMEIPNSQTERTDQLFYGIHDIGKHSGPVITNASTLVLDNPEHRYYPNDMKYQQNYQRQKQFPDFRNDDYKNSSQPYQLVNAEERQNYSHSDGGGRYINNANRGKSEENNEPHFDLLNSGDFRTRDQLVKSKEVLGNIPHIHSRNPLDYGNKFYPLNKDYHHIPHELFSEHIRGDQKSSNPQTGESKNTDHLCYLNCEPNAKKNQDRLWPLLENEDHEGYPDDQGKYLNEETYQNGSSQNSVKGTNYSDTALSFDKQLTDTNSTVYQNFRGINNIERMGLRSGDNGTTVEPHVIDNNSVTRMIDSQHATTFNSSYSEIKSSQQPVAVLVETTTRSISSNNHDSHNISDLI